MLILTHQANHPAMLPAHSTSLGEAEVKPPFSSSILSAVLESRHSHAPRRYLFPLSLLIYANAEPLPLESTSMWPIYYERAASPCPIKVCAVPQRLDQNRDTLSALPKRYCQNEHPHA